MDITYAFSFSSETRVSIFFMLRLPITISWLTTDNNSLYRRLTSIQNEKGAIIKQRIVTYDNSAATDVNNAYTDSSNSLKPTDVYEYFDGRVKKTWNNYSSYGDIIEQKVYLDGVKKLWSCFSPPRANLTLSMQLRT